MEKFTMQNQTEQNPAEPEDIDIEKQEKIINGCLVSLEEMVSLMEKEEAPEEKKRVIQELSTIVKKSNCYENLPSYFLNKLKYTTLAAIDMLFIDEMAKDVLDKSKIADRLERIYGRNHPPIFEGYLKEAKDHDSDARVAYVFLDLPTLEDDMREMAKAGDIPNIKIWAYSGKNPDKNRKEKNDKLSFSVLDDVSDLEEALKEGYMNFIVVSKILEKYEDSEKVNRIIVEYLKNPEFKNVVVAGLKLTEKVGVMQIFEGNDIRLRSSIFMENHLPMQEKVLALLESGVSFLSFEKPEKGPDEREQGKQKKIEKADMEDLDRKIDDCLHSLVVLERNVADRYVRKKMEVFANNQDENNFLKRHEEHYKKFFSVGNREAEEILLTRSGVSANDVAIKALGEMMPKDTKVYYQTGWYYENERVIEKNFTKIKNVKEATALFINLDSCYPDNPEGYQRKQKKLIADFLEKARNDKERKYALVVDITTDLLWGKDMDIPENLALMKTFSLSKHQRGSQNYFFGGVVAWNSPGLREKMENDQDKFGGRLMTTGIINYPRLRISEIKKNMEDLKVLAEAFANGVNEGQSEIAEADRLRVYSYNYYSYIVFPYKMSQYPVLVDDSGTPEYHWDFKDLAEPGDSFGLNQTRVCFVPKVSIEEPALRFSFGLKENKNRTFELGLNVAKKWEEFMKKIEVKESSK